MRTISLPVLACVTALVAATISIGCPIPIPLPRRADVSSPATASSSSAGEAPSARAAGEPLGPRIVVETTQGASAANTQATFAPTAQRLLECAPANGGILRVRIDHRDRSTRIAVDPGAALSASAGRCTLETLSTADVDDLASRASPSDRPSGFSAWLRIEW